MWHLRNNFSSVTIIRDLCLVWWLHVRLDSFKQNAQVVMFVFLVFLNSVVYSDLILVLVFEFLPSPVDMFIRSGKLIFEFY